MNALFVCNTNPFPPRDGVTVPMCSYIQECKANGFNIDLLLLTKAGVKHCSESDGALFENVFELSIREKPLLSRCWFQVVGQRPFFSGWVPGDDIPDGLHGREYSFVFSSPRSVVGVVHSLRQSNAIKTPVHVAAVNDIAAVVKRSHFVSSLKDLSGTVSIRRAILSSLGGVNLSAAEQRFLDESCDLFVVQSHAERDWVLNARTRSLSGKCLMLSNGVDDEFFALPIERNTRSMTFVGRLEGHYADQARWLLREVWRPMRSMDESLEFTVSGISSDVKLVEELCGSGVRYRGFVENQLDLYSRQTILLAPIFKGYGLINKVVQAMAAGTLVIGDETAFNAVPGFEDGKHGIVAKSGNEFRSAVKRVFESPDMMLDIRSGARELMSKHFRWCDRGSKLLDRITLIGQEYGTVNDV